jgi:hypothetical protein
MSWRSGDAAWPQARDAGSASAVVWLASRQGEPAWVAGGAAQAGLAPRSILMNRVGLGFRIAEKESGEVDPGEVDLGKE